MWLTDKKRVELVIPPLLLAELVTGTLVDEGDGEYHAALAELAEAMSEPLCGLVEKARRRLAQRAWRIVNAMLVVLEDGDAVKVLMAGLLFVQHLVNSDKLVLVEGSAPDRAIARILKALECETERWEVVQQSAVKASARLLKIAHTGGFYL